MPALAFDGVTKRFGDTVVVDGFTARIPDQEFLVLLGPSGCGKSTMLRMIAGLIDISAGSLCFDERVVNDLGPRERDIAFVFQSYALYPHMSVRANIAFPLLMGRFRWWQHIPLVGRAAQSRAMRDPAISERVEAIAELMELTPYLERRPRTLSGGQRQRVALARALVREPSMFLLDEPLSNLDAKLRAQMRVEIGALYRRVKRTFVYVTHDQVEAMTMGTRIIVMDQGRIQQDGTPKEIYDHPANTFVARFIGQPPMNLFGVTVEADGVRVPGAGVLPTPLASVPAALGERVTLGVRAERVAVTPDGPGLRGRVVAVEQLGGETVIGFRWESEGYDGHLHHAMRDLHYAKMPGDISLEVDAPCRVLLDTDGTSWFDHATGRRLLAPRTSEVAS